RISNDILPSTTHRVVQPRDPALRSRARVSFPMAVYVWEEEVLEVLPGLGEPRYAPIKAVQFRTRISSKVYGDDYAVTQDARGRRASGPKVTECPQRVIWPLLVRSRAFCFSDLRPRAPPPPTSRCPTGR